jgi:hypothetical protein
LDPDIIFGEDKTPVASAEPLLVNLVGSLAFRPNATIEIPNMFLASDYVRTITDGTLYRDNISDIFSVACMETANEAARRAVNGILDVIGSNDYCEIFQEYWPDFTLEQDADCLLYDIGEVRPTNVTRHISIIISLDFDQTILLSIYNCDYILTSL